MSYWDFFLHPDFQSICFEDQNIYSEDQEIIFDDGFYFNPFTCKLTYNVFYRFMLFLFYKCLMNYSSLIVYNMWTEVCTVKWGCSDSTGLCGPVYISKMVNARMLLL